MRETSKCFIFTILQHWRDLNVNNKTKNKNKGHILSANGWGILKLQDYISHNATILTIKLSGIFSQLFEKQKQNKLMSHDTKINSASSDPERVTFHVLICERLHGRKCSLNMCRIRWNALNLNWQADEADGAGVCFQQEEVGVEPWHLAEPSVSGQSRKHSSSPGLRNWHPLHACILSNTVERGDGGGGMWRPALTPDTLQENFGHWSSAAWHKNLKILFCVILQTCSGRNHDVFRNVPVVGQMVLEQCAATLQPVAPLYHDLSQYSCQVKRPQTTEGLKKAPLKVPCSPHFHIVVSQLSLTPFIIPKHSVDPLETAYLAMYWEYFHDNNYLKVPHSSHSNSF